MGSMLITSMWICVRVSSLFRRLDCFRSPNNSIILFLLYKELLEFFSVFLNKIPRTKNFPTSHPLLSMMTLHHAKQWSNPQINIFPQKPKCQSMSCPICKLFNLWEVHYRIVQRSKFHASEPRDWIQNLF